ncbi:uncharacterized protein [Primulina eburnea]|uniref:uncharacterized protein n=1 Tax=Primulina eburnea TaxID=1245227 RepID=UPI003C6CAD7F
MSCIAWNAPGLGNQRAFRELKRLVTEKKPTLLFLSETRRRNINSVQWKMLLGFMGCFTMDCVGRSGGLCLLWMDSLSVSITSFSTGHIDFIVTEGNKRWRFTGFYGNPNASNRLHSWELLRRLADAEFRDTLDDCALQDLHCRGELFTWANRRMGNQLILERLDRFVGTLEWRLMYPTAYVQALEFFHSDHRPIYICLGDQNSTGAGYSLQHAFIPRFEAGWIREKECKDIVAQGWRLFDDSLTLHARISNCLQTLQQ